MNVWNTLCGNAMHAGCAATTREEDLPYVTSVSKVSHMWRQSARFNTEHFTGNRVSVAIVTYTIASSRQPVLFVGNMDTMQSTSWSKLNTSQQERRIRILDLIWDA
jgi:hypothetical protein